MPPKTIARPRNPTEGAPNLRKAVTTASKNRQARLEEGRQKLDLHIRICMYLQIVISFAIIFIVGFAVMIQNQDIWRMQAVLIAISAQTTLQFSQCYKMIVNHYFRGQK